jgi:hypothetical protein
MMWDCLSFDPYRTSVAHATQKPLRIYAIGNGVVIPIPAAAS